MPSVYAKVEAIVNELGGRLWYERRGREGVSWFVSLPGYHAKECPSDGKGGVPLLDALYQPKNPKPKGHADYTNTPLPDARDRLISMVKES